MTNSGDVAPERFVPALLGDGPVEPAVESCGRAGYSRPASLLLFDVASGRQTQQLTATLPDSIYYATAFHPGGSLLAVGSSVRTGEVGVWRPGQARSSRS